MPGYNTRTSSIEMTVKKRGVKAPKGAKLLAMGATGATFTYPDKPHQVSKLPFRDQDCLDDFEIEKRIYRRLGTHPNIINCLQIDDEAIFLERAKHSCIRLYYKDGGTAILEERIKWSRDLANVVQYLHDKNVRQGEIGGRNILLDVDRNIRICVAQESFHRCQQNFAEDPYTLLPHRPHHRCNVDRASFMDRKPLNRLANCGQICGAA